jgi:hypothetical protein
MRLRRALNEERYAAVDRIWLVARDRQQIDLIQAGGGSSAAVRQHGSVPCRAATAWHIAGFGGGFPGAVTNFGPNRRPLSTPYARTAIMQAILTQR